MMLSACDECRNKINKRKCKRFPKGKPKDFRPYIDMCEMLNIYSANPKMAPWESFPSHGERCRSDEPYGEEFLAKCKEEYREYMRDGNEYCISLLMEALPYHLRREVINA